MSAECCELPQRSLGRSCSRSRIWCIVGGPFVKRFALCYRTVVCPVCPVGPVLSVTFVYCGQTVGWIRMKLGTQVGLGPGHIVLYGDPTPSPKGAQPPIFAHICCGQMAGWIKTPLGREVGFGPSDIVLDGDPAPPPQKGGRAPPNFRPMSVVAKRLDGSRFHLVWR